MWGVGEGRTSGGEGEEKGGKWELEGREGWDKGRGGGGVGLSRDPHISIPPDSPFTPPVHTHRPDSQGAGHLHAAASATRLPVGKKVRATVVAPVPSLIADEGSAPPPPPLLLAITGEAILPPTPSLASVEAGASGRAKRAHAGLVRLNRLSEAVVGAHVLGKGVKLGDGEIQLRLDKKNGEPLPPVSATSRSHPPPVSATSHAHPPPVSATSRSHPPPVSATSRSHPPSALGDQPLAPALCTRRPAARTHPLCTRWH